MTIAHTKNYGLYLVTKDLPDGVFIREGNSLDKLEAWLHENYITSCCSPDKVVVIDLNGRIEAQFKVE